MHGSNWVVKRRDFIALLGGAAASWSLAARAQQPARLYRIGMLDNTSAVLNAANLDGFRQTCGSSVTSKDRASSSNIGRLMVTPSGTQIWQLSWFGWKSTPS
jgi:hypothetical protein